MGKRDSSKTRVVPVFDALFARDPTGRQWLEHLVALPAGGSVTPRLGSTDLGDVEEIGWGTNEKGLKPPLSLLKWLVCNPPQQPPSPLGRGSDTILRRRRLTERDAAIVGEALRKLDHKTLPDSAWFILEGLSYPDVFLRTRSTIIVIEGKRTEWKPTRTTTWMPVRDQLLRHVDCAWEIRESRKVLGIMVVEGDGNAEAVDVPRRWFDWVRESRSGPVLEGSLPHRTDRERVNIANAILGVTTWQRLCAEFGIDWASLPDRCA